MEEAPEKWEYIRTNRFEIGSSVNLEAELEDDDFKSMNSFNSGQK